MVIWLENKVLERMQIVTQSFQGDWHEYLKLEILYLLSQSENSPFTSLNRQTFYLFPWLHKAINSVKIYGSHVRNLVRLLNNR